MVSKARELFDIGGVSKVLIVIIKWSSVLSNHVGVFLHYTQTGDSKIRDQGVFSKGPSASFLVCCHVLPHIQSEASSPGWPVWFLQSQDAPVTKELQP